MKRNFGFIALLFAIVLLLPACKPVPYIQSNYSYTTVSQPAAIAVSENLSGAAPSPDVNLLFTGDIMFHGPSVQMQWDKAAGKYDFTSYFEQVAPIIQSADFAIGNLESPVWDYKKSKIATLQFCAPIEAIDAMQKAGFDLLCTANNHAMDQGLPALANTIQSIQAYGMKTTGTYRNAQERDTITMLEKNGVKIAILAYARSVNRSWRNKLGMGVNMIDIPRMKQDMANARAQGADAVIFFLHFGTEYTHKANSYQKNIIKQLQAAGANAVIGHHPHVLQPMGIDSSGSFFYAYSLGNIVTAKASRDRQFAAMLNLTVHKDKGTGKITITNVNYIPTWARATAMPGGATRMRVFDLRQALIDCQAGTNPLLPKKYLKELKYGMTLIPKVLGPAYLKPLPTI